MLDTLALQVLVAGAAIALGWWWLRGWLIERIPPDPIPQTLEWASIETALPLAEASHAIGSLGRGYQLAHADAARRLVLLTIPAALVPSTSDAGRGRSQWAFCVLEPYREGTLVSVGVAAKRPSEVGPAWLRRRMAVRDALLESLREHLPPRRPEHDRAADSRSPEPV